MKSIYLSILIFSFSISSIAAKTDAKKTLAKPLDARSSSLHWLGKKVTGEHKGTVQIKSGKVDLAKGTGEVVVDMTTIVCKDLEGEWKTKLENHLRSDDFFSVDKHKTATLTFKEIKKKGKNKYDVKGNLKIKGTSHPISFSATDKNGKFAGQLTFDRTKYGIKYKSGKFFPDLGDKMIYDDVTLTFEIALK